MKFENFLKTFSFSSIFVTRRLKKSIFTNKRLKYRFQYSQDNEISWICEPHIKHTCNHIRHTFNNMSIIFEYIQQILSLFNGYQKWYTIAVDKNFLDNYFFVQKIE